MEQAATQRSPWHAGELALQRREGVAERMAEIGPRVIRPMLIEQHRLFYPLLPFIVLGTLDREGRPWASLRAGRPGFLQSPDPKHLEVSVPREPQDPTETGLDDGEAVGLLGIDLATKRRNRLNGTIAGRQADGFNIEVEQSFGNCPQYIERRAFVFHRDPDAPSPETARPLERLDDRARAMIRRSDGFFVASYAADERGVRQVDVSHRGGDPGFVAVADDDEITVPDYSGNRFFASLGNMLLTHRAGVVFVDFSTGDLLQITGDADVVLDAEAARPFPGAERLWTLRPRRIVHRPQALPLHWERLPDRR